jgi:hypothetical protein
VRFIDDILTIGNGTKFPEILASFNNIHSWLQFTFEPQNNKKQLNYLDITITIAPSQKLQHQHFRKPTQTNRAIHYNSHQDKKYLIAALKGEVRRVSNHTQDRTRISTELKYIKRKYLRNGYPASLVNHIASTNWIEHCKAQPYSPKPKIFAPYIPQVTEMIHRLEEQNGFQLVTTKTRNLKTHYRNNQRVQSPLECRNVVYQLNCQQCDLKYIGTTKQKAKERFYSHKSDVKHKNTNSSLYQHNKQTGHTMDLSTAKILHHEKFYKPRFNLETLEIIKNKKSLINHILPTNPALESWTQVLQTMTTQDKMASTNKYFLQLHLQRLCHTHRC